MKEVKGKTKLQTNVASTSRFVNPFSTEDYDAKSILLKGNKILNTFGTIEFLKGGCVAQR